MSHEAYKQLAPTGRWILTDECDSLLFSCLHSVGMDVPFLVDDAFDGKRWHRRPIDSAGCCGCSSTISRDMLIGLFVYSLHFRRLDILDQLWSYAWSHKWKVGVERKYHQVKLPLNAGYLTVPDNRTWMTPSMMSLLYQLRQHLRGKSTWARYLPDPMSTEPGFQSHLSMLKIYLHLRMYGEISNSHRNVLNKMLEHNMLNPLVHALLGNRNLANALLRRYWPEDRLPTSSDWTEEWRTQRADGDSGLRPGKPGITHSGGDLLFVQHVMQVRGIAS